MKKLLPRITAKMYGNAFILSLAEKLLWLASLAVCAFAFTQFGLYPTFGLSIILLLLMQIYRFYMSYKLMKLVRRDDPSAIRFSSFPHLLKAACLRVLYGFIWCVPFAVIFYQLYRYVFVLPAPEWNRDFTTLGALFSPAAASHVQMYIGTAVFFVLVIASFLLFVFGWNRWKAFDFQQVANSSLKKVLRNMRFARKSAKKQLFFAFWLHVLVCLPAFVLPLILPYLKLAPLLSGKVMNDLYMIYTFLKAGFVSNGVLLLSCAAFIIFYVPFLPWRKLRNAAAVVNCYERK